jgi:ABC-type sugar transport system permease subunit
VAPALAVILLISLIPIAVTVWEALHVHDLRLPWLGRPFIGAGNFMEAANDPRFGAALFHTVAFALISVPLELMLGLALAVMMHSAVRGRALIRVSALLPWAIPTVVAALLWRFMFEAQTGILAASFRTLGVVAPLSTGLCTRWRLGCRSLLPTGKTTPPAILLLAASRRSTRHWRAARIDGGPSAVILTITLPLHAGARHCRGISMLDVAAVRSDARGHWRRPGTATEPASFTFIADAAPALVTDLRCR